MYFWDYMFQFHWDLDHLSLKDIKQIQRTLQTHVLGIIFDQMLKKTSFSVRKLYIIQRYKSIENI